MSKTVDDLRKIFKDGQRDVYFKGLCAGEHIHLDVMERAGITAVVRALRDAIVEGGNCKYCVSTTAMYNEILGSDARAATACATSQTTGVINDNRQSERERHFPQGLQTVDGGGAEAVGRCERCGDSLTRRDQSQLAFESAILGDYEARRGRNVGGESNHRLSEKVAGSTPEGAVLSSSAEGEPPASPATDHAPAVCEWNLLERKQGIATWSSDHRWHAFFTYEKAPTHCDECGKPIRFAEAKT